MSPDQLEELEKRSLDAALASGRIEDLDKAANVSKQIADIRKAGFDSANQPKLTRNEEFKTWAALLVPFLSIATLAVTIFIQADQLKATREANEDLEWRETVKNVLSQLSRPATVVADPALAMSLLEPYTTNERYGRDATLLSIHLLSSVPSSDPFKDFFVSHHIGDSPWDLHLLTDTDRKLYAAFLEVEQRLQLPHPPSILEPAREAAFENMKFVDQKLCSLYHKNPLDATNADLRSVFLINCDLSGLDLASVDLTEAKLQSVNLKDVSIGEGAKFQDALFVDSNWWDARSISKQLLRYLIDSYYPYYDPTNVTYDLKPPDKEQYTKLVTFLCQGAGLSCSPELLKYGEPVVPSETGGGPTDAGDKSHGPST